MSIHRTPPQLSNQSFLTSAPVVSYGSDSQLYVSPVLDIVVDERNENITRRLKRKLTDNISADTNTNAILSHIEEMFSQFESQQNTKFERLMESVQCVKEQNSEIQKSMEFLAEKYDTMLEKMSELEQINRNHERNIELLESKIEQLERNSRSSAVEIRNIPKQAAETKQTLRAVVKKVGEVLDQPLTDSEIQDVYRLKTKKESSNHIVVNFTTTLGKEGFIRKCRTFNKINKENKLNTSHLQLPGPSKPVYIDESLTTQGKRLAYLARQFTKENKYYGVWTSYGKIFIKRTQDSSTIRIQCEQDLKNLQPK